MADDGSATGVDETALTAPLLDPAFYAGDPYPLYARLRAEAPVARNDTLGLWLVSRHADVVEVSRDPATFCSSKGIMTFEIGAEYATPPTMMHTDPPDHTRYRNLVQPGFRPSYMRGARGRHPGAGPGPWSTGSSPGCRSTSWPTSPCPFPCR